MAATLAPFRLNARLAALTIVAVLAVACSSSSPTETPAPTPTNAAAVASATATAQLGYTPAFEGAACEFEVPADERVRCGWLVVPEDRSDPSGTQVRLHVAIFRSRSGNPEADPVVYLEGGPGGHALETVPFVFDLDFAPFLANRDFIMFDQRGAGYSEPSLYCQERVDLTYELLPLDLTTAEVDQRLIEVLNACRDRLRAEGANLAFYASAQNATDLADLRVALGYDEWNLFGVSYGTRLALTAMRDHPEGIRSVILDSTYPPQVDGFLEFPSGMVRALNVLFDSCRSDAACARAYPDLERTFLDAVARLNEEPVRFDITHPLSGQTFDALYNGDSLVGLVFQSLYSPSIIPLLPEAISDTVRGLYGTVAAIEGQLLANNEFSSTGMYYSVQCAEEARFVDEEAVAAENARYPEYLSFLEGEGLFRVCDEWGAYQAGPIENEPVASNIPTLVLAGGFDPITPPSYGRRAADTLSRSFFFEVPSAAHGVANDNDCTRAIALAFVDDPLVEPDAACIRGLAPIGFTVLETEVALTSYTDAVAGFATRVPADWEEVQPGFYARTQIGATFLLVLSIPTLAVPFAVDDFADLAGAGAAPVPTERTIGDVEWRIYEIESGTERTSVGAGDLGGGDSAIVLFRGPAHVVDVLHTPVFVAAVENLRAN